jgi:hypothetical protein
MKYSSVFLLLLLSVAAPARAQDCCRVEGVVRAADGAPIPVADVTMVVPDAKEPRTSKTDERGHYVFEGVKPGIRVEIRIVANGRPIASSYTLVTSYIETLDLKVQPETGTANSLEDLDPMGGDAGEVRGTVRGPDGTPLAGAHVIIAGTPVDVMTDSAGRFSFGRIRSKLLLNVQASATGFESAAQEVTVPVGTASQADFEMAATTTPDEPGLGLATTAPDRAVISLPAPSIASIPSLTPYDVFRSARFLPTAAIGQDESELVLHGSAPDQTYMNLDGMPWYSFPRLAGGLTAPYPTESIQRTDLTGAPVDSEGAGRLGGLFQMSTISPAASHVSGTGEVGMFGPSGSIAIPIANVGSAMIGGRHSWPTSIYSSVLDRFSGAGEQYVRDRSVQYTGGTLAASPDVGFSNFNGRVEIAPAKGNRAYVSFFTGNDANNFSRDVLPTAPVTTIAPPDPFALPSDAVLRIGDVQSWTGRGISGVWERRWSDKVSTSATVAQSRFTNIRDQAYDLVSPTLGDLSYVTLRGGSEALTENNEIEETTVRVSATIAAGFAHALELGVEHAAIDTTYASQSELSAKLVPFVSRTESGTLFSVFAQDIWRPQPKLTITPGVRLTNNSLASSVYVDPRATASYAVAPRIVVKATYAIEHQGVNRVVREDLEHGDGAIWTLSDGTVVPVGRSQEATGGITVDMPGLLFDAHAYFRVLDGLSLFAPRLLPGTALTAPNKAFYTGTGKAGGLELLVQHRDDRNTVWVSYAGGRVEYTYPGLQNETFPAGFDRTHQVKAADTFRVVGPLTVTSVFLMGAGAPYTASTGVQQVWFSSGTLAYAPAFDTKNSSRLPLYNQLDISGQVAHHFGAVTASVGVTVFNVYDRTNVAYFDYEAAGPAAINSQTQLMRRAGDIFFRVGF